MDIQNSLKNADYLGQNTSRKVKSPFQLEAVTDSFSFWIDFYMRMAINDVKSKEVAKKIKLYLERFRKFFIDSYGHERISICKKRDVLLWRNKLLEEGKAHSTINNHMASLSGFTSWVCSHSSEAFQNGNPCKGIGELALPPLQSRALNEDQIISLKNVCDRLERFYQLKGRRWAKKEKY